MHRLLLALALDTSLMINCRKEETLQEVIFRVKQSGDPETKTHRNKTIFPPGLIGDKIL
jgi:hypothetical protein